MLSSRVQAFLGGRPADVGLRLVLLSLIVGVLLHWLDIRPPDLLAFMDRAVEWIRNLGTGAIRQLFGYILTGAVIVLPLWLILRLVEIRQGRR
jgi:hypothetical protein